MPYMKRALELSRQALGLSSPNPPVGAVIVKDGQIVGEGHTREYGQAHAERIALDQAGELATGGDLYTTLEPCCHYGNTPPCTEGIIKAGISQVHVATIDPNPLMNGNGIKELEMAGIQIFTQECSQEASEVAEGYLKLVRTGKPFVTAKFAMSLDGKIASTSGDSKWISSEDSRTISMSLRQQTDAIIVGVGTILQDNPNLTVRNSSGEPQYRQPVRVVVDTSHRTPNDALIYKTPGSVIVVTSTTDNMDLSNNTTKTNPDLEILVCRSKEGSVDLISLLAILCERGITNVLVEGGGTLLGSFFDLGLIDKVVAFISPLLIGGNQSISPIEGQGSRTIGDAVRLKHSRSVIVGDDVMMTGYVR